MLYTCDQFHFPVLHGFRNKFYNLAWYLVHFYIFYFPTSWDHITGLFVVNSRYCYNCPPQFETKNFLGSTRIVKIYWLIVLNQVYLVISKKKDNHTKQPNSKYRNWYMFKHVSVCIIPNCNVWTLIHEGHSISFQTFFVWPFKILMRWQTIYFWIQVQINSYSSNWNTPY